MVPSDELVQRLSALSGVPERDIGLSGLKDRNAVTRQWFSVGMAGRREPDWQALETGGDVQLLELGRHSRKLRRGVHRANRFSLVLRGVSGDRADLERRLQLVRQQGAPNYFGEQRFGRNGATLEQACRWARGGHRRQTRARRSLYLSALRAFLFNTALATRVAANRSRSGARHRRQGNQGSPAVAETDTIAQRVVIHAVTAQVAGTRARSEVHELEPTGRRGRCAEPR